MRWTASHRPWVAIDKAISLSDLRYQCKRIDLVDLVFPPELQEFSRFAWVSIGKGGYRLGISRGTYMTIAPTILGLWETVLHQHNVETILYSERKLPHAIQKAEHYIQLKFQDSVNLVLRNTFWRSTPASQKQIKFLRDKNIEVPQGITKGQSSHIINMLISA